MVTTKYVAFTILSLTVLTEGYGQKPEVHGASEVQTVFVINGYTPFWFTSNNSGRLTESSSSQLAWISSAFLPVDLGKGFSLASGMELVLKEKTVDSYINQLFVNLRYKSLLLRVGRESFTLAQYNDEIGLGSMFLSTNARPFTRIGLGFYEYTPLPFLKDYLQFKGALQLGKLTDTRGEKGTRDPWIQEKFFYLKTARSKFNVWVGMNHSVLMGGTHPNGGKIPVDFWASFIGGNSDKFDNKFEGEASNAAGAHFGLFDFGTEWKLQDWHLDLYYQKPFTDGSGIRGIFNMKHDKILGVNLIVPDKKIVNQLVIEYMNTGHQSGPGTPDYVYDKEIPPYQDPELNATFLRENFGVDVQQVTYREYRSYLDQFLNQGYATGGRDDYYNNYLYFKGNSFHSRALGTPLFYTQNRTSATGGLSFSDTERFFVNNRVKAFHFGISGWLNQRVRYRLLETLSVNYGTYSGLYGGRYSWDEQENYFFKGGKRQNYFLAELTYHLQVIPMEATLAVGNDSGGIFESTAAQIGVSMRF